MKFYYGVTHIMILNMVFETISAVFTGSNRDNTERMLIGTSVAETSLGTYPDAHPNKLGVGLMQMDRIAFEDVKARTRNAHKHTAVRRLSVDVDNVLFEELATCPMLSVLFARLFYMLVPEQFPSTDEGMADYWKEHYNTSAGEGTPEDFMNRSKALEKKLKEYGCLLGEQALKYA
jgi:hypothetical protein